MNQTRKITTETWIRDIGEDGQASFYPQKGECYPPHLVLHEQEMIEFVDFLLECLEYLHPETPYTERHSYNRQD